LVVGGSEVSPEFILSDPFLPNATRLLLLSYPCYSEQ